MINPDADALWYLALLGLHVVAGLVALGAGLGAIVTRKGGRRHNAAGRLYVATMTVAVGTAVPLSIRTRNWFLLAIAVFSGYLVFGGYRAVARRRAGLTAPTAADYAGHGTMLVAGCLMILGGGWRTLAGPAGAAPALVAFGGIGAGLAALALSQSRKPPPDRAAWIRNHVAFMGGGYIATVTAAITVNLAVIPPLVRWLGPTVVGTPLIVYGVRKHEPRFDRSRRAEG